MRSFLAVAAFLLNIFLSFGQTGGDKISITIENDNLLRKVVLEDGQFSTQLFLMKDYPYNFVSTESKEWYEFPQKVVDSALELDWWRGPNPEEFSFLLNNERVTGKTGWNFVDSEKLKEGDHEIYRIILKGNQAVNSDLELIISYVIFPALPVIRKKIAFRNTGSEEIKIESLDIESLNIPWGNTHNVVYQDYARYKFIGPFLGNWNDALVLAHDPHVHHGFVIGNEAPGVVKRTSVCLDGRSLTSGLTHSGQDYAFRKWLVPGEQWESTWVFTGLYHNLNPREAVDGLVSDFVRKHMGIRLAKIPVRPAFVYNTWNPFRREVDEKLIRELADAAAACGVEEFIIDDGWQVGFGDWEIDYEKFPNGLKPVFDYVKSKGMKPGLWMSMGAASTDSKVFQEHPEWFARYRDGQFVNLHDPGTDRYSACFTTGWKDYIKGKILNLVQEHGLEYVKLDFAVVASAYRFDPDVSGCFADGHPHKDREESYLEIYRRAWRMYDELHEEAPDLFIDCTFETMGELQLVDYDMCKHAEGNWLSNFEGKAPFGSMRVRQMSWWRSPVIPATALVIGNQSLDDEDALFSYKSLAGSLPIMLGDPRKMSPEKQHQLKAYSTWLREMENKHQIMLFRQDLPGFGEPVHGSWDGFQRINTDTGSGGIMGVFKQFSPVDEKWITLKYLDDEREYVVKLAPSGEVVARSTGKGLREKGFKVIFREDVQGELYEVTAIE
ncbi:MAG: alpha-galactosidase [Mariniphaga sp.]